MYFTTPTLTLAIYARQMDRRDGELERLKALVEGVNGQRSHSSNVEAAFNGAAERAENGAKSPVKSAISPIRTISRHAQPRSSAHRAILHAHTYRGCVPVAGAVASFSRAVIPGMRRYARATLNHLPGVPRVVLRLHSYATAPQG